MEEERLSEKDAHVEISLGPSAQDYQVGNFLNALDHLCCHFDALRTIDSGDIADAMALYAKGLREI